MIRIRDLVWKHTVTNRCFVFFRELKSANEYSSSLYSGNEDTPQLQLSSTRGRYMTDYNHNFKYVLIFKLDVSCW